MTYDDRIDAQAGAIDVEMGALADAEAQKQQTFLAAMAEHLSTVATPTKTDNSLQWMMSLMKGKMLWGGRLVKTRPW